MKKESDMDPQQTAVYAKAHEDLQELFRQIARHGRVTAQEIHLSLLPFTAGDAKCDLEELVADMKRRQTSLDEADFIRVMWRKMYLNNLTYTALQRAPAAAKARPASASVVVTAAETMNANIPMAHVIVSIKRRAQLKQFASYYASRGISGADHLDADKGSSRTQDSRTPRHLLQSQKKRRAVALAAAQAASMAALRGRESPAYDVVACYYDGGTMRMQVAQVLTEARVVNVANCSRLYCSLTTAETGPLMLSCSHFVSLVRAQAARRWQQLSSAKPEDESMCIWASYVSRRDGQVSSQVPGMPQGINVIQLERMGLRSTVAMGVGRGLVTVATERRVHTWTAFAPPKVAPVVSVLNEPSNSQTKLNGSGEVQSESEIPPEILELLEDEGDTFGHVPLLKRAKTLGDVPGIRTLVCGDRFAIGVTAASELYAWGSSPLGRSRVTPTKLVWSGVANEPSGAVIVSRIVCGLHHVMLLSSLGTLYAWGSNVHGQLGLGPDCSVIDADVHEPTEVKLASTVLDIACGDHHSLALSDKGTLFAWGNNWHGQLGLDPNTTDTGCVFTPTKINWRLDRDQSQGEASYEDLVQRESSMTTSAPPLSPQKTVEAVPRLYLITAVGDTTAAVSEQGHVFTWGKCVPPGPYAGACGIAAQWRPQRLDILDELLVRDNSAQLDGDETHSVTAAAQLQRGDAPWNSIAIANGLVLLTKHTTPSTSFSPTKNQYHTSKILH